MQQLWQYHQFPMRFCDLPYLRLKRCRHKPLSQIRNSGSAYYSFCPGHRKISSLGTCQQSNESLQRYTGLIQMLVEADEAVTCVSARNVGDYDTVSLCSFHSCAQKCQMQLDSILTILPELLQTTERFVKFKKQDSREAPAKISLCSSLHKAEHVPRGNHKIGRQGGMTQNPAIAQSFTSYN